MPWPATVGNPNHTATIGSYSAASVFSAIGVVGALASRAWEAAQTTVYFPFRIAWNTTVTGFYWMNGATAAGNVDCGIYDKGQAKVTSSGATAQTGTSVIQTVALGTPVRLAPGLYYMALMCTSASATMFSGPATGTGNLAVEEARHIGISKQDSVGTTLPATATFAAPTASHTPVFGFYTRNVP